MSHDPATARRAAPGGGGRPGGPAPYTLERHEVAVAAALLAGSVPAACAGLVPYHAAGCPAFLAAALYPPPALRTLILRAVRAGGEVAAVADWRLLPGRLFLNGVTVREDRRGQGHGGRLLADGARLARAHGVSTLELDVAVDNAPARAIYRRAGFEVVEYAVWTELAGAGEPAGALRLVDWPAFEAHRRVFGFGDLAVRHAVHTRAGGGTGGAAGAGIAGGGYDTATVRVVRDSMRVPPGHGGLAAALRDLLPVRRVYTVRTAWEAPPSGGFASFARMRWRLG